MNSISISLFITYNITLILSVIQIYANQLQLTKCCQMDEIYDMASKKCIRSQFSNLNENYPMDPAFAYYDTEAHRRII